MREILFRGKAVNREKGSHRTSYKNGDWVYGLITRLYDGRFELLPAEMRNENGVSGIEIDYRTIGQYTGLTDKNGKKIFEGDIIKHYNDSAHPENYATYQVKWCAEKAKFVVVVVGNGERYEMRIGLKYEIIGNIHDKPELLKGGADNER